MRKKEIVKEFGEAFVAQTMQNLGYEVDRLDAEGIDLAAYAFVISKRDRIDLLIATQSYVCKQYLGIEDIKEYMSQYKSKKDAGSTKSFNTSLKSREKWSMLSKEEIIYTSTLCSTE
ncbi:MAG: hypothetical protein ACI4AB_08595 [Acetatifactor sp.]